MSNEKQNNPTIDFGFHAVIPRIIRTEYKMLTPVQKWLYVCLKDLCGDHGTCYRSIRALAEETNISTGMLSESIPILHNAGLIHAEKKKRSTGGKEVWHITIVDIWRANALAHPTKRSQNEQTIADNVHTVNKNVHRMNKLVEECSQNEQECSLCETEVITRSNNNTKAIRDKHDVIDSANATVSTPALSLSSLSDDELQLELARRQTTQPSSSKTVSQEVTRTETTTSVTQPPIPFEELPWGAEKALAIIEKLVGKKYRSQEKELKACKKILTDYKPDEETYLKVISRILPWYQSKEKLLHPTDLAAKTQRGRVRFEELLEEVEYQAINKSKPTRQSTPPTSGLSIKNGQRPEDYSESPQARRKREELERQWAEEEAQAAAKGA